MEEQKMEIQKKSFLEKLKNFYYKHEKYMSPKALLGGALILFIVFFVIYVAIVHIDNNGKSAVIAIEKGYVELAKKHDSVTTINIQQNDYKYELEMKIDDLKAFQHEVVVQDGGKNRIYYYVFVDYTIVTKNNETIKGIYLYKLYYAGSTLNTEMIIDIQDDFVGTETSYVSKIAKIDNESGGLITVNDDNYSAEYTFATLKDDMNSKGSSIGKRKVLSYVEYGFKDRATADSTPNANYANWFVN